MSSIYGKLSKLLVVDQAKNSELVSLAEVLRRAGEFRVPAPGSVERVLLCGREHDIGAGAVPSCGQPPTDAEVLAVGDSVRILYLQRLDGDLVVDHPAVGAVVFRSGPLSLRAWR